MLTKELVGLQIVNGILDSLIYVRFVIVNKPIGVLLSKNMQFKVLDLYRLQYLD